MRLAVEIGLDASIAKLRGEGSGREDTARTGFTVELPAPLAATEDLLRAIKPRLERTELLAPAVEVVLRVTHIVPAHQVQLDLSRDRGVDPDTLPSLLAELSADIGPERIGLLSNADAFRPEASSRLVPVTLDSPRRGSQISLPGMSPAARCALPPPSRMLRVPVPLGRIRRGSVVAVASPGAADLAGGPARPRPKDTNGAQLFAIEELTPLQHLHDVEWWGRSRASRDYFRAWLTSGDGPMKRANAEALVHIERRTGEGFLQGWYE